MNNCLSVKDVSVSRLPQQRRSGSDCQSRAWSGLMRLHGLVGGLFLMAMAAPAAASGGLDCSIEDKSVRFTLNSGVTRGMGSPTFNLKGKLEILEGVVAEDFRTIAFDGGDRPQYWLDDKDLRLLFYKERLGDKPFGSVALEIRTKPVGEEGDGTYEGTYELQIYDASINDNGGDKAAKGKVSCFVE